MPSIRWCVLAGLCAIWPGLSSAHELWIEPASWQVDQGAQLSADIRNGEFFAGGSQVWQERNITRAEVAFDGTPVPLSGRTGDRPALAMQALKPGLAVMIYETTPSSLTYNTWDKFQAFVDHKALPVSKSSHLANGHPEKGFTESYTRHAKSLVQVGGGSGIDKAFGLETEIVAKADPYAANFDLTLPVEVFYQGQPRQNAQVEIFEKSIDGKVEVRLVTTDLAGRASIDVKRGHAYLIDSVVLRPGTRGKAIYDTLWAALTFYVPE